LLLSGDARPLTVVQENQPVGILTLSSIQAYQ
jgi:predicted transcriptional regulator